MFSKVHERDKINLKILNIRVFFFDRKDPKFLINQKIKKIYLEIKKNITYLWFSDTFSIFVVKKKIFL